MAIRKATKQREIIRIETVGIVGAGMMGIEITAANVRCGIDVWLCDITPEIFEEAPARLRKELVDLTENEREAAMAHLHLATLEEVAACDLIIEAISESYAAKANLFRSIQHLMKTNSILVSNTSTISINTLSEVVAAKPFFAGLHFLHPVRSRELVEIISSKETHETVVQSLCDYLLMIDKTPLCIDDCPGFVVNRLLHAYLGEALNLLGSGISMEEIEQGAADFRMFWGPLRFLDEVGLDVAFHSGRVLYDAYPDRVVPSPILISMVKKNLLGRKTGLGFYDWGTDWKEHFGDHDFAPVGWNEQAREIVQQWQFREKLQLSSQEIGERLATAMAVEGGYLITDGILGDQTQIDMATVTGLGFPIAKTGPMAWFSRTQLG